jgi:hypothetical protein
VGQVLVIMLWENARVREGLRGRRVMSRAGGEGKAAGSGVSVEERPSRGWLVVSYGTAIFLGAFLLFQLQPLIGKYILPWFGGSIEVWTTCMLFFQVMLLLGYLYAHLTRRLLPLKAQTILHGVVVLGALALLPVIPADRWKPSDVSYPTLRILWLLLVTTGLPFFALAATSPLLQSWLSALRPKRNIYRLYALSNAGSLLALISYPFLVEPFFARHTQSWIWSAGLLVFAASCVLCARPLWASAGEGASPTPEAPAAPTRGPRTVEKKASSAKGGKGRVPAGKGLPHYGGLPPAPFWLLLPAAASMMLLASTNMICLEVASFPFLWVLPLTLYLLTFILAFGGERWYPRRTFIVLTVVGGIGVAALRYHWIANPSIGLQILIYMTALFASGMICHGETYRLRPPPERLTSFYLLIACGGALGGFVVAIIAPLVFNGYWEVYIALPLCLALGLAAHRPTTRRSARVFSYRRLGIGVVLCTGAVLVAVGRTPPGGDRTLERTRNFYGVLRVMERTIYTEGGKPDIELTLRHVSNGPIGHGSQVYDVHVRTAKGDATSRLDRPPDARQVAQARAMPTTYYSEAAGGIAMLFHPDGTNRPRRIGIVGLGAGTLAVYGRPGDTIRYYEINPEVAAVADRYFTYLSDCRERGVDVQVLLGDGRLLLQKEPSKSFDILVIDAFTGDAVPLHMLTEEAFAMYLDRLRDDGVLSIHVSNMHLDLRWAVARIARALHVPVALIHYRPKEADFLLSTSDWVILTRNPRLLEEPAVQPHLLGDQVDLDRVPLWTDDYSSLFAVLRRASP